MCMGILGWLVYPLEGTCDSKDPEELAEAVHESWSLAPSISICSWRDQFGFMNGCSAWGTLDLPQVTSYDWGALLNEQGNPTEKYYAISKDDGDLLSGIPTARTTHQRVFTRTNLAIGSQD